MSKKWKITEKGDGKFYIQEPFEIIKGVTRYRQPLDMGDYPDTNFSANSLSEAQYYIRNLEKHREGIKKDNKIIKEYYY